MSKSTLIGPFSQLLTMDKMDLKGPLSDDLIEIINEAGVVVENGKISQVGDFSGLSKENYLVHEVEEPTVLIPGLIDCHTHMVWGGNRAQDYSLRMRGETYEKILENGGGIFDSVSKTREASENELFSSFEMRLKRHLESGITTVEVKSGYGLDVENELKMLRVINKAKNLEIDVIPTCLAAHVCPDGFSNKTEYLDHILIDLLPEIKKEGLTKRIDVFVEPSAFSVEFAKPYLLAAKEMGFDLTLHADQFTPGGSQLAVELEAKSADHLESSNEREIEILSKSDVVPVALPGASIGLGMRFTPARKLLDAGCSLSIATDWNPGSAPMGDLLTQASILGIYEKLSTAEVLAGTTFRSANALGLQDRGVLRSGYLADFVGFSTSDYRDILYNQGQLRPSIIWKNGKCLTG